MSALSQWMLSADPHPHIALKPAKLPGRGGGYGMVALQEVKKGEKLVSVPRKVWMTSQTAKASPLCQKVIESGGLDAWKSMCLHLLCERRQGANSYWHPYIDMLPAQDEHPLAWSDRQVEWLAGSPMAAKLTRRRDQVGEDIESLKAAGANEIAFPDAAGEESALVTLKSMRWGAATLLSRAFNLQIPLHDLYESGSDSETEARREAAAIADDPEHEDERILALVPWADTLNHTSSASERSILQYDATNDAAVLFAHRDYAEGDEVFDSYGRNLTPSELLLDYGFVDTRNRISAVTVPAHSITSGAGSGINDQLLAAINTSFNGSPEMTITDTGIDDTLLSYVRCAVAPEAQLLQAGWQTSWTEGGPNRDLPLDTMARLVDPIDFNTEAKVIETLSGWCDRQLQGYANAIQNDREELEDPKTAWLRTQVLRALVSEKQAILGIQRELRDKMQQLKEGCPLDTLYE